LVGGCAFATWLATTTSAEVHRWRTVLNGVYRLGFLFLRLLIDKWNFY